MRVIFILSTNYAGSHLLTQLLGAHPRARSVGELHNYRKFIERPDSRHSVVYDFAENSWFAGLGDLPPERWHATVGARVMTELPGVDTLVDNSKRVEWARRFVANTDFEAHFVHLIRDPRALVRRWGLTYDDTRKQRRQRIRVIRSRPHWMLPALFNDQEDVYCRKWLISNQRISHFLADCGQSANVVTYHDLARHTSSVLGGLMPRLGLAFDPLQLNFGEVAHHGTMKREYLEQSRRSEIKLDLRWQQEMTSDAIRRVSEHAGIVRYLAAHNVRMIDDGLTCLD